MTKIDVFNPRGPVLTPPTRPGLRKAQHHCWQHRQPLLIPSPPAIAENVTVCNDD
ncbi:hypothetical protein [Leptolyngbya iicbica]|uniref:Uncharacterized protein n=1 Tax=Lyngbya confervoides BDU141951 TaxID=1574623 RepID=A0A8T6QNA2_9CYAN|nr:hypothetical protein [Leptolyngbya sp. LK]